jgi:peptidoglycan/LPS O-acetylase OafA/YrhL
LKGLAILTVIFAHIGFYLVNNHTFLYPLSTVSGVGVNIFLFLSGFGLVMSSLKRQESLGATYKHRFLKLLIPFWLTLGLTFLADYFLLGRNYGWPYIIQSLLGFFNHADLYADVNSPLWYITITIFYYLLFPLLFYRKRPWLSAIAIFGISFLILLINPAPIASISYMYSLHLLAFPLGMILANLFVKADFWKKLFQRVEPRFWQRLYWPAILIFLAIALYFMTDSHVGEGFKEELASLAIVSALLALFIIKKKENGFLYVIGLYSYEIYLIHWPLMYRYDFLFRFLPVWLALALYIPILIGLGWLIQKASNWIGSLNFKAVPPTAVIDNKTINK